MDDDARGLRHCRRRHASADADIDQLRLIVDYAMIAGGAGNGAARFYWMICHKPTIYIPDFSSVCNIVWFLFFESSMYRWIYRHAFKYLHQIPTSIAQYLDRLMLMLNADKKRHLHHLVLH